MRYTQHVADRPYCGRSAFLPTCLRHQPPERWPVVQTRYLGLRCAWWFSHFLPFIFQWDSYLSFNSAISINPPFLLFKPFLGGFPCVLWIIILFKGLLPLQLFSGSLWCDVEGLVKSTNASFPPPQAVTFTPLCLKSLDLFL